jgi:hypothetical protein
MDQASKLDLTTYETRFYDRLSGPRASHRQTGDDPADGPPVAAIGHYQLFLRLLLQSSPWLLLLMAAGSFLPFSAKHYAFPA